MKELKIIFSTLIDLKWSLQIGHWNHTGENFYSLHKMYEEFYKKLDAQADEIAERIRMIGEKINPSLSDILKDSKLNKNLSDQILDTIINNYQTFIHFIQENPIEMDQITTDMITELLSILQKQLWFLNSHLGKN